MIVPVLKERLAIEKRLVLTEELHIIRRQILREEVEPPVTLRIRIPDMHRCSL